MFLFLLICLLLFWQQFMSIKFGKLFRPSFAEIELKKWICLKKRQLNGIRLFNGLLEKYLMWLQQKNHYCLGLPTLLNRLIKNPPCHYLFSSSRSVRPLYFSEYFEIKSVAGLVLGDIRVKTYCKQRDYSLGHRALFWDLFTPWPRNQLQLTRTWFP